jgi:hypothetical protein
MTNAYNTQIDNDSSRNRIEKSSFQLDTIISVLTKVQAKNNSVLENLQYLITNLFTNFLEVA